MSWYWLRITSQATDGQCESCSKKWLLCTKHLYMARPRHCLRYRFSMQTTPCGSVNGCRMPPWRCNLAIGGSNWQGYLNWSCPRTIHVHRFQLMMEKAKNC